MTDRDELRGQVPEVTPLDELASALLDGEAAAEEQGRTDDPEVAARMARFAEVAAIVGREPVAASPAEADQAISAALDAWDTPGSGPTARPELDELADRRRRRARTLRVAGVAAAAIAVIGLGVTVIDPQDSADQTASDTATSDEDTGQSTAGGGDDAAEEDTAEATAPAADAAGAGASEFAVEADLGRFEDLDDLVRAGAAARHAAGESDGAPLTTDAQAQISIATCAEAALSGLNDVAFTRPFTVQTATLSRREVVVLTSTTPDGPRVVVLDAGDCELLADRTP
jgi:hypothetical protein